MSDEHQSFIKSPRQLIVIVALAFIVPIVVIALIATLVQTTPRTGTGADAMTPEAIAQRLAPIGRLEVDAAAGGAEAPADSAAATASQPAATAPATAAPAAEAPAADAVPAQAGGGDLAAGAKVYKATCAVCHNAGVAGAPKLGDAAAWKPRLAQGFDVLVKHSIDGIRAMPPRGGNARLTDDELRDAVAYMVDAVQ